MAELIRPIITFNTGTGSDTAASGAGPAMALSGTGASLNATTTVDLSADTPDLSGVATDGSAAIWVDASSGRQWGRITAVDNGLDTVTVNEAFTVTEGSRNWGIGGKRDAIDATSNLRIASPDGESGWQCELDDDQTISVVIDVDVNIRYMSSTFGTRRTITQSSASTACFSADTADLWLRDIKLQNSNGTPGNGVNSIGETVTIENCEIGDATNSLNNGLSRSSGTATWYIIASVIHDCDNDGINSQNGVNCYGSAIINNGAFGCEISSGSTFVDSVIQGNASGGIRRSAGAPALRIWNCTIDDNGGPNIDGVSGALQPFVVGNTQITHAGTYGWDGGTGTTSWPSLFAPLINNNWHGNTSGNTDSAGILDHIGDNDTEDDPGYSAGDADITPTQTDGGYPQAGDLFTTHVVRSYQDIGAIDVQGGSGGLIPIRRSLGLLQR